MNSRPSSVSANAATSAPETGSMEATGSKYFPGNETDGFGEGAFDLHVRGCRCSGDGPGTHAEQSPQLGHGMLGLELDQQVASVV